MTKNNQRKKTVIGPIFRLTLVFMLAQIGLIYLQKDFVLRDSIVRNFLHQHASKSGIVMAGLIHFALAQVFLYLLFMITIWWLTRQTAYLLRLNWTTTRLLGMIIFLFALFFVFFANQLYFPNSFFAFFPKVFSQTSPWLSSPSATRTIVFISGAMLAICAVLATLGTLFWLLRHPALLSCVILIALIVTTYYFYYAEQYTPIPTTTTTLTEQTQPNIILIGFDSLRPTDLTYYGNPQEKMPVLDEFLKQSTVFLHSLTPAARTSPSWVSILTGNYPKTSNIRFNLTEPSALNIPQTLPGLLRQNGYRTLFSTDDRQFDQVNEAMGFDTVIGAKRDFNDFLLSNINDFPLSNLIMNTKLGAFLFPYNYANRASAVTYIPDTYNKRLADALNKLPKDKPLFLAVHFTMPHWPFGSASIPILPSQTDAQGAAALYEQTLPVVDQQFSRLMHTLKRTGILENSIVFVLSDHGNTFKQPGDRVTTENNYVPQGQRPPFRFYTLNFAMGHGTDVLTLKQYHTLLAVRYFTGQAQYIGKKGSVVTTMDITPTVLDLLHIPADKMQGISLLPLITSKAEFTDTRPVFIETDFTLPAILSANPNVIEVLNEGIAYYTVLKDSGMVVVNPFFAPLIIKGKNRAIIYAPWMLALYPNSDDPGSLVLVNLATRQWTTDMNSDFARNSPLISMATLLKHFYGNEIIMPNLLTENVTQQ